MKHLIVLLGITACSLTPLAAQNTPGTERSSRIVQSNGKPASQMAIHASTKSRCIYYITSVNSTGSHIPVVIRRYRGVDSQLFGTSHGSTYSSKDIGLTGSLNVEGALNELDPAISSAHR